QQRSRQPFHDARLQVGQRRAEWRDRPRTSRCFRHVADELSERVDRRAAELEALTDRFIVDERAGHTGRDVADEDRLEPCVRGRERYYRKPPRELREEVEERVIATEYHRRPENRPCKSGLGDHRFTGGLRALVAAWRIGARAKRAHVQDP